MSAEKPEIGDVWENDGLILHIDKFSEDKYGKIIYCYDMDKKGYVAGCWYYLDIFLNNAKYQGKSKASVNDLFQTEQDVANNVAKPTLQHLQAENNRLRETLKSQIKALLALKGFYPETSLFADDNIRRIKQSLNGESEE